MMAFQLTRRFAAVGGAAAPAVGGGGVASLRRFATSAAGASRSFSFMEWLNKSLFRDQHGNFHVRRADLFVTLVTGCVIPLVGNGVMNFFYDLSGKKETLGLVRSIKYNLVGKANEEAKTLDDLTSTCVIVSPDGEGRIEMVKDRVAGVGSSPLEMRPSSSASHNGEGRGRSSS